MKIRNQARLCRAVSDFELCLVMLRIITVNVKLLCDHESVLCNLQNINK